MKVKCLFNLGSNLPEDCLNPEGGYNQLTEFHLEIDKQYVVYSMTIYLGYVWYYICDEAFTYYPIWNPSPLFDVVDGRLSKYWNYSFKIGKTSNETNVIISFPEWAEDPFNFYDKLSDGEDKEKNIFKKYKNLMDLEFPDEAVKEKAIIIDKNWIMCPFCMEAWDCASTLAMVECPKCKSKLHNPKNIP